MNLSAKIKNLKVFSGARRRNGLIAAVVAIGVFVVAYLVIQSRAGGWFAAFDAANGTISGNAEVVDDASASGGKAIVFAPASPVPSPVPQPEPQPEPQPQPSPSGFPSASNTGWQHTGVTLKPYTGSLEISQSNVTLDGYDFTGCVHVTGSNVTIKRSRIRGTTCDFTVLIDKNASGTVFEDVEVTAVSHDQRGTRAMAVDGSHATMRRVYAHGARTGVSNAGNDNLYVDSFIGDQDSEPANGQHTSGFSTGGSSNLTLRHNTIELKPNTYESSAIAAYAEDGKSNDNWLVENNLFNGGGYCVVFWRGPERAGTSVIFRNNSFGNKYYPNCGDYGPAHVDQSGANSVWSGNVWYTPGTSKNGQVLNP